MLLVAKVSLNATDTPVQRRVQAARRTIATLARLARLHELVVVADWPDRARPAQSLVDALGAALPWHEIVLVAARVDKRGRHPGSICNVPTVRRLVEDGAVVVCLAGGPGGDRTEPVARALAQSLHADGVVQLAGGELTVAPSGKGRSAHPYLPDPAAPEPEREREQVLVRTGTPAPPTGW